MWLPRPGDFLKPSKFTMIISCITTASNKAVLIKGIPFRIVQIKGFVVNTKTNQVLHICINRLYDLLMTCCLHEKVFIE